MRCMRVRNRLRHNHCCNKVRGNGSPRKEVGTMGYLVIGIAFIVLAIVAAVRTRAEHV